MKTLFSLIALLVAISSVDVQGQDYFGQYASKGALESLRIGVIEPGLGNNPGYYYSIGRVESFPGVEFYRATRTSFSGGFDIDLSNSFLFVDSMRTRPDRSIRDRRKAGTPPSLIAARERKRLRANKPYHKIHLQLGLVYGSSWHVKTPYYEGNAPKSDDFGLELGLTLGLTPKADFAISHDRSTDLTFIGLVIR